VALSRGLARKRADDCLVEIEFPMIVALEKRSNSRLLASRPCLRPRSIKEKRYGRLCSSH